MLSFRNIIFFFFFVIIILQSWSCNTTKYLKQGEKLVAKNQIKIHSDQEVKNKTDLIYDLSNFYKQEPNSKFLGMFKTRLWFYYKNQDPSDTTKWNNWVRRVLAEEPSIHIDEFSNATAAAMENYLHHKGYFDAYVYYEKKNDEHYVYNTYSVHLKDQYTFGAINYESNDSIIDDLINQNPQDRFLITGEGIDIDNYNKEVSRLVRLLRNEGYYEFGKNYISPIELDTTFYDNNVVEATLKVLQPTDSTKHQKFKIGNIKVYPNYEPHLENYYEVDDTINGVTYMTVGNPKVRYSILERNIKLKKGDVYSLENEETTRNRLSTLGIYKFISIKTTKNDSLSNVVDFKILLPSYERMALSNDLEFTTATNTARNLSIGTNVSSNYRNRNLFNGAEVLTVDLEAGLEVALRDSTRIFNSVDVNARSSLAIPKFVDYIGTFHLMKALKILPEHQFQHISETAKTKMDIGYSYVSLFNFYDYQSFEASAGYIFNPKNSRWRINMTQSGINYFNPETAQAFDTILVDNVFLQNSFKNQLFTGLLFRDIQLSYQGRPKNEKNNWSLRFFGEVSGLEELILNRTFSPDKEWQLFDRFSYAHYMKWESDLRWSKKFNLKNELAMKSAIGIAFPLGRYSTEVPYVKQFSVGGPNSIRAWSIRELGPGGYYDFSTLDNTTVPFYQTGDLKLEGSIEYRFDLFWLIDGATFIDVGNVWLLKADSRENAELSPDFWKQFAIGTGLGIRLDFTYFIMRFDLGYPLRYNYPGEDGNYWQENLSFRQKRNFNLAIGYPF